MQDAQQVSLWQHPPLWYDRRRDDHSRVQRMDGDVVAPFYETPWGRSGQGRASDGLSLWDVTKPNRWYYQRLRRFADIGAEKGLILFNGLYMQHSILEAGAHYVDAPWRPANNVNPVGIPEPVFFAGEAHLCRRAILRSAGSRSSETPQKYMRQALDELADQSHIVFYLSEEFTGPVSFVQFWLDTIAEWKEEKGKSPLVALYATKDVTDAILNDAKRSLHVSLIYNRFNGDGWWYQPDGALYAPQGGKNLAPRQWSRLLKPKNAGFHEVHRAVREYRLRFPDKPFVYKGTELLGWATFWEVVRSRRSPLNRTLLASSADCHAPLREESTIGLEDREGNQLLYSERPLKGDKVQAIDMQTGRFTDRESKLFWVRAITPAP